MAAPTSCGCTDLTECIGEVLRRLKRFEDFLNAAETCKRFQKCAMDAQYKFESIAIEDQTNHRTPLINIPSNRAPMLLHNFGHLIKSINWRVNKKTPKLNDEIYESIVQFCGKTLNKLHLFGYNPKFSEQNPFQVLEELMLFSHTGGMFF